MSPKAKPTSRRWAMGRRSLAVLPFLFLACGHEPVAPASILAPNFQATSTWTRSSFFVDVTLSIPCLGENVRFHGEVPFMLHEVTTPSGGSHSFLQLAPLTPVTPPYFAEGLTSGTVYRYHNGLPINQMFSAGPGEVITIHDREVYVADNGAELRVSFVRHLTVNANGDVIVDRAESSDFLCGSH
jgi:hypothetical protein